MPEQVEEIEGVRVNAVRHYQSRTFGQVREGVLIDGADNEFLGSMWQKGNCTLVHIRKYAPGGTILNRWNVVFENAPPLDTPPTSPLWNGVGKIDDFAMCQDGRDLLVTLGGHDTDAVRQNPVAVARIPDVFEPPAPTPVPVPIPEDTIWCEEGNRPYLRVNQAMKRGGAIKLIVLGIKAALTQANFNDPIPAEAWTFQDVPPQSTHWDWTERMARATDPTDPNGGSLLRGTPCVPRP